MRAGHYTYPGARVNLGDVSIGDLNVSIPVERNHQRINFSDEVSRWRAIPKMILAASDSYFDGKTFNYDTFGVDEATFNSTMRAKLKFVVVPDCSDTRNQEYYWNTHKRLLGGDATAYNSVTIPSGKTKAYLHSLSFVAYDFNEPLPYYDPYTLALELFNSNNPLDLKINKEVFTEQSVAGPIAPGTNSDYKKGYIVAFFVDTAGTINNIENFEDSLLHQSVYPFSPKYTTAEFPVFGANIMLGKIDKQTQLLLNQTAPRSAILHGALPSDWIGNNFSIKIYAYNPTLSQHTEIWDTKAYYAEENRFAIDEILHQTITEIDVIIPTGTTKLIAEVTGPGWFVYSHSPVDEAATTSATDRIASAGNGSGHVIRTMVQHPVKVMIDLRFEA